MFPCSKFFTFLLLIVCAGFHRLFDLKIYWIVGVAVLASGVRIICPADCRAVCVCVCSGACYTYGLLMYLPYEMTMMMMTTTTASLTKTTNKKMMMRLLIIMNWLGSEWQISATASWCWRFDSSSGCRRVQKTAREKPRERKREIVKT